MDEDTEKAMQAIIDAAPARDPTRDLLNLQREHKLLREERDGYRLATCALTIFVFILLADWIRGLWSGRPSQGLENIRYSAIRADGKPPLEVGSRSLYVYRGEGAKPIAVTWEDEIMVIMPNRLEESDGEFSFTFRDSGGRLVTVFLAQNPKTTNGN